MSHETAFSTTLILADDNGWHLRPASMLAKIAHLFDSDIVAEHGKRSANARSVLGLLMLCATGKHLRVTANGHDARDAIKAIETHFASCVPGAATAGVGTLPSPSPDGGEAQYNSRNGEQTEEGMNAVKTVAKKVLPKKVAIAFTCGVAPDAKEVFVAGDFNEWDPSADPMTKRSGQFCRSIRLTPGEHQYKFVIDGKWHTDPTAPSVVSELGTINSVIRV